MKNIAKMEILNVILPTIVQSQKEVIDLLKEGKEFRIADISSRWDDKWATVREVIKYCPEVTHLKIRYSAGGFRVIILNIKEDL